ncbi:MAG: hypothetical protein K2G70_07675 [Turicibacter sp.]|nr:hypothetical protein [Turicibacter sp.]
MKRSHRMCSNKLNTKLVTGEQLSSRQERILANEISCNIRETRVWLESLARSCEHDIPRLNVELKNLMVNLDFNKETRLYVCAYRTIVEEFRAKTM